MVTVASILTTPPTVKRRGVSFLPDPHQTAIFWFLNLSLFPMISSNSINMNRSVASISGGAKPMAFDKDLLEIMACPKCKGPLHLNEDQTGIVCDACRLVYGFIEGEIPNMIIEEAEPLEA